MRTTPDWLDRTLRAMLRLPGALVEWVDGEQVVPGVLGPEAVFESVRRGAQHPEAYLGLETGLHHLQHDGHVLAWQHRGRTAFGIGGVNAPPGAKRGLLDAYRAQTADRGIVRQLLFPVRPDELAEVGRAGFWSVQVGVEAWLDPRRQTFEGKAFANLRQMRNRARARGVTPSEVRADAMPGRLEEVHQAWLRSKRPSWRMKLLIGSPCLERPFDWRYFVVQTPARVEAFATLLPGPVGTWGLDVMARRPDAVPGSMERLLVHAIEVLGHEGAHHLSLGPCPMAGVPFSPSRPVLTGLFRLLYGTALGNRVFGFRSLVSFKQKFQPTWRPVYFAASPHLGVWALYRGCRMWGLY